MTALIAGLLLCYFVLAAEQVLLAANNPHDANLLRHDSSAAARRAAALLRHIQPAMSALLLARLLLQVLLVVFGVRAVLQIPAIASWRAASYEAGVSFFWPTIGFVILLSAVFAAIFWGLRKLSLPLGNSSARHLFWLQRLSLFISFWKVLFRPFLKKASAQEAHTHAGVPVSSDSQSASMPQAKVVGVDLCTNFHEVLAAVQKTGLSRVPVYDQDIDNVTGMLYVKDLLPHLQQPVDFEWQALVRTHVLSERKSVSELLLEFRQRKSLGGDA